MNANAALDHPKITGAIMALLSLAAGAAALLAADFGKPAWIFAPLLCWLVTFGIPTTFTVLLLAAVWGTVSPLHGFGPFVVVATVLSIWAHVKSVRALRHFIRGMP